MKIRPRLYPLRKLVFYVSVGVLNLGSMGFWLHAGDYFTPRPAPITALAASIPEPPPERQVIFGKPVRVVIPRLNIDLKVLDGVYNPDDFSWTLSDNNPHFATPTALVNDFGGNTLIYGHNTWRVFGPLKQVGKGDVVKIYSDNDYIFTYRYQRSENVKPDDVSIFTYQGPPVLTLQTCTGNWNELRQMSRFKLVDVIEDPVVVEARRKRSVTDLRRQMKDALSPLRVSVPMGSSGETTGGH